VPRGFGSTWRLPALPAWLRFTPAWTAEAGAESFLERLQHGRVHLNDFAKKQPAPSRPRVRDVVARRPKAAVVITKPVRSSASHRGPNGVGTIGDGAVAHDFDPGSAKPRPSSAAFVSSIWPSRSSVRS